MVSLSRQAAPRSATLLSASEHARGAARPASTWGNRIVNCLNDHAMRDGDLFCGRCGQPAKPHASGDVGLWPGEATRPLPPPVTASPSSATATAQRPVATPNSDHPTHAALEMERGRGPIVRWLMAVAAGGDRAVVAGLAALVLLAVGVCGVAISASGGAEGQADARRSGQELCRTTLGWRAEGQYRAQDLSQTVLASGTPAPLDASQIASLERRGRDAARFASVSEDPRLAAAFRRESKFYSTVADDERVTADEASEAIILIGIASKRCIVIDARSDLH